MTLATDMKQHFALLGQFNASQAALEQIVSSKSGRSETVKLEGSDTIKMGRSESIMCPPQTSASM